MKRATMAAVVFLMVLSGMLYAQTIIKTDYCCEDTGNTGCCNFAACVNLAFPGTCAGIGTYSSLDRGTAYPYGDCDPRPTFQCTEYNPFICCLRGAYSAGGCVGMIICYQYHSVANSCDTNKAMEKCP